MNRKQLRKKRKIREIDKCYICNNKAQLKCGCCKQKICNDCLSKTEKGKCYKCDEYKVI